MLTVMVILLIVAIVFLVAHVVHSPFPLWPSVLVVILMLALQILPVGK